MDEYEKTPLTLCHRMQQSLLGIPNGLRTGVLTLVTQGVVGYVTIFTPTGYIYFHFLTIPNVFIQLVPKQNHVTFIPFHLGKNWLFFLLTITISYVIDSLYISGKRDAQLNSEMHSFLYHTDFGGSDHHRKKLPQ